MTMDEITKLATELERHAQADVRTGCSPEDRHPARIAARAALLRAVEDLELEAAKAGSWRQAAEGFRRERDDLAGRFATETKERDRCRDGWANERARAEAAEKERDLYRRQVEVRYGKAEEQIERLTLERDAANATAQRIAERLTAAESALAAMRETMEVGGAIVAWVEQELRAEDTEGTAACPGYPDKRELRSLIDRWRALSSAPPSPDSGERDAELDRLLSAHVHAGVRCGVARMSIEPEQAKIDEADREWRESRERIHAFVGRAVGERVRALEEALRKVMKAKSGTEAYETARRALSSQGDGGTP